MCPAATPTTRTRTRPNKEPLCHCCRPRQEEDACHGSKASSPKHSRASRLIRELGSRSRPCTQGQDGPTTATAFFFRPLVVEAHDERDAVFAAGPDGIFYCEDGAALGNRGAQSTNSRRPTAVNVTDEPYPECDCAVAGAFEMRARHKVQCCDRRMGKVVDQQSSSGVLSDPSKGEGASSSDLRPQALRDETSSGRVGLNLESTFCEVHLKNRSNDEGTVSLKVEG